MNKLLIATHNPAKIDYFKEILDIFNLDLVGLSDLGIKAVPIEDGLDEVSNALIKARFYALKSNHASLADDAGLYIPALNYEPGLQIRRWNGNFPDDINDEEWLEFFLKKIKTLAPNDRHGYYLVGRAIVAPGGREYVFDWKREVIFSDQPNQDNYKQGWPIETVCFEKRFLKPFTKLTNQEKLEYENDNLEKYRIIFNNLFNNANTAN